MVSLLTGAAQQSKGAGEPGTAGRSECSRAGRTNAGILPRPVGEASAKRPAAGDEGLDPGATATAPS
jgi:hypothetical protein